jgi:hypothetical protein
MEAEAAAGNPQAADETEEVAPPTSGDDEAVHSFVRAVACFLCSL